VLKTLIVRYLPFLGRYKRFCVAIINSILPAKQSYSQHREDIFVLNLLKEYTLEGSLYVDIGANHPSDISNTYLLYRHGLNGIIIEPNEELINLFRKFRKRDIPLMVGCSNEASVLKFNISKTPVISSFSQSRDINTYKSTYIPVMSIDSVLSHIDFTFISFLSIDVEGLNYEVLQGASVTIKRSLVVCIEFDLESDKGKFNDLLGADFELLALFGCNLIYFNKILMAKFPAEKK